MIAVTVFLIAGTVKGVVGIGLPTTAIGLMTLAFAPREAMALLIFPMVVTNAWQVWRMGDLAGAIKRYWLFASVLFVGVGLTTLLSKDAPDRVLFGVLGVVILAFVAVNFAAKLPAIPSKLDSAAQVFFASIAGVMGGLTAVWAPPMVIYLTARAVDKDEFVRATGFLIFLGSLPLLIGYLALGLMDGRQTMMSAIMLVPTLLGFTLGEHLRSAMSQERFRRVLLLIFLALGLNLLRRAIWG